MRFGKFCGTNTSDVRRTMYDVQNQRLTAMWVTCFFLLSGKKPRSLPRQQARERSEHLIKGGKAKTQVRECNELLIEDIIICFVLTL